MSSVSIIPESIVNQSNRKYSWDPNRPWKENLIIENTTYRRLGMDQAYAVVRDAYAIVVDVMKKGSVRINERQ